MSGASRSEPGQLRAGAVKVDITPAELGGLYPVGGGSFAAVHDRIHLRTLLLSNGAAEVAIISLDLIEAGDMTGIRGRIQRELGIPAEHVMICATHTHSAPRLGNLTPGAIAHEPSPEALAYTEVVYTRILETLAQARERLADAQIAAATGAVDINVNRDEYVDGRYVLGRDLDGPSDKTLSLVSVTEPAGAQIAVLMAYAVHPAVTIATRHVSGDIAGEATRYVERRLADGVVALWAAGGLGDQAPRAGAPAPAGSPSAPEHDAELAFELAAAQGVLVGAEAVRLLERPSSPERVVRIGARERIEELPARHRPDDAMKTIRQRHVDTVPLRVITVVVGSIALVGVGGELVCAVATAARSASPLSHTLVLSCVNDRLGYLPDDAAYARQTFAARGAPVTPGCAERTIVSAAGDAVRDLIE